MLRDRDVRQVLLEVDQAEAIPVPFGLVKQRQLDGRRRSRPRSKVIVQPPDQPDEGVPPGSRSSRSGWRVDRPALRRNG